MRLSLSLLLISALLSLSPRAAAACAGPGEEAAKKETPAEASPSPDPVTKKKLTEEKDLVLRERVAVVGNAEKAREVPGSAHVLTRKEIEREPLGDVHQLLRQVPGVYVQEEEGFGLRPNIGMRGSGVERSQKITLLEDGILIAPAPYSAPAAYYFPTAGRMEAIEVRKGSSSIKQGPYTTGGALNLISTSVPDDFGGEIGASAGEDGFRRLTVRVGDSSERFGWLLETYQLESDGFKELDGGGPTGFRLEDYVAKLKYNTPVEAAVYQSFELKVGRTDQSGDETYLGLTDTDFARTPYRRYAASREDGIETEHTQVALRHFIQPTGALDITTTLYRNDFFRNWTKLDSVSGRGLSSVLERPEEFADEIALLRGESDSGDDALSLRNNRRDYYSQGIQSVAGLEVLGLGAAHSFELGLRYHEDEEDRFQEDDLFAIRGGRLFLTSEGAPGSQDNRVGRAEVWAVFFQDEVAFGRWTLTPGVRYENISFERRDYRKDDPDRGGEGLRVRRNGIEVIIPGVGARYRAAPSFDIFAGVHRGFAPPGPGADSRTRPEESVNYELGARLGKGPFRAELVGFFNDYENLLGRDTLSSGGTGSGDLFNAGKVSVAGLETSLSYDAGKARGWRFGVPARLTYTYTAAEFETSFETSFADWEPSVSAGDELPYLPEHQGSAGIGLSAPRWGVFLQASYFGRMRTSPGRGPIPDDEATDPALLLDLSGEYALLRGVRIAAQVRNLTDEVYRAARRPAGLRPGMPRTASLGVVYGF